VTLAATERSKYRECWSYSQYRHYSPGEWALPIFREINRKKGSLIDLGCGTGRAGAALSDDGYEVTLLDFADNCRDFEVKEKGLSFIRSNLWTRWSGDWDIGYCCDVMEHIPPEKCEAALKRIFANCVRVFFTIHFGPDNFGQTVGHPLHLNVQPFTWWRDKLAEHGKVVHARDLIGIGAFLVEPS
jgi:2-polyprenyl-3-methyl-5-hydroxy-6-metoxy-1,4-benzoquinol methylase